jgi:hypothetical protein
MRSTKSSCIFFQISLSGRDGAGFPSTINVAGIGRALLLDAAFGDILEEACRSGRKSAECQKIRFETDSGFVVVCSFRGM